MPETLKEIGQSLHPLERSVINYLSPKIKYHVIRVLSGRGGISGTLLARPITPDPVMRQYVKKLLGSLFMAAIELVPQHFLLKEQVLEAVVRALGDYPSCVGVRINYNLRSLGVPRTLGDLMGTMSSLDEEKLKMALLQPGPHTQALIMDGYGQNGVRIDITGLPGPDSETRLVVLQYLRGIGIKGGSWIPIHKPELVLEDQGLVLTPKY